MRSPRHAKSPAAALLLSLTRTLQDFAMVRRYMAPHGTPRSGPGWQAWSTFVRNHARAILACDFFVAITATFRMAEVFGVVEVGARRIVHCDSIYSEGVDRTLTAAAESGRTRRLDREWHTMIS